MLLKEDRMSIDTLKLIWATAKSDHTYQAEIFKIINDVSLYLKIQHVEFFFNELTQQAADKLTVAEFDCLVDLGKYNHSDEFQTKIGDFFWRVIVQGGGKKELVQNCITKYSDMVKSQNQEQKIGLLNKLVQSVTQKRNSVTQILRLFTKLIKDEKSRIRAQRRPVQQTSSYNSYPTSYGGMSGADGTMRYSYSYNNSSNYMATELDT
jgi:hypothetical protein